MASTAKFFWLGFGNGDPRATIYKGLHPTFAMFIQSNGTTIAPPAINEIYANAGVYGFSFTASPTLSVFFLVDAATGGFSSVTDRYIRGTIDTVQFIDQVETASFSNIILVQAGISSISSGVTGLAGGITNIGAGFTSIAGGITVIGSGFSTVMTGISALAAGLTAGFAGASSAFAGIGNVNSSFGTTSSDPTTVFGYLKRLQELQEGDNQFSKTAGTLQMLSRGSSTVLRNKLITQTSVSITKSGV